MGGVLGLGMLLEGMVVRVMRLLEAIDMERFILVMDESEGLGNGFLNIDSYTTLLVKLDCSLSFRLIEDVVKSSFSTTLPR